MIFYTADTHFGHANILRLCGRPFASVEEMNEKLIERWNEKVQPADTVYILGDMFFRTTEVESILERLRGKKHLIVGNHDDFWMHKVDLEKYFLSVNSVRIIGHDFC
ncbi:MAG: metallophosphoesterase, partial [Eubacteriales bacterium]